jgi:DNA-binding GntR family transcriptional regulator
LIKFCLGKTDGLWFHAVRSGASQPASTAYSAKGQNLQVLKKTAHETKALRHAPPAHQHVYCQLREAILFGDLVPGEAVTLLGLTERLQAGMTPVREAVRRLISDGALLMQGNRRVIVPQLSPNCLEQIDFMRLSLEPELLRRAFPRLDPALLDTLASEDDALNTAIAHGDIPGYLKRNYAFHRTLYAIAEAPIMTAAVDSLWLRFGPSLRVVCGRSGTSSLPDRHHDLLNALHLQREGDAIEALKEDIRQGTQQIRAALPPA